MKVPGVGETKKSTVLLFGVAGAGVIIFAIYQKRKAAAAAAASASTATPTGQFTDPAGNVCSAPNSQTGYCPGTPEDTSATEQLAAASTGYGLSTGVTSLAGNSVANNAVPVFTTNGAWSQYVEQMLGSNGTDATAAAIAKYLAGTSLTSAQQTAVEQAIAIANYPPVSGSGGFPPSINLQGTTTATTTSTPAPASTTTTQVNQYAKPAGLSAHVSGTTVTATWSLSGQPSPLPHSYTVAIYTSGGSLKSQTTVSVPDTTGGHGTYTTSGLAKGAYHVHVWANGGKVAPPNSSASFTIA